MFHSHATSTKKQTHSHELSIKNQLKQLYIENDLLRIALHTINKPFLLIDSDGFITDISQSFTQLSGYSAADLEGTVFNHTLQFTSIIDHMPLKEIFSIDSFSKIVSLNLIKQNGQFVEVQRQIVPLLSAEQQLKGAFVLFEETNGQMTPLRNTNISINEISLHLDPLTGLNNRRYMEQIFVDFPLNDENLPLAILLVDINGLIHINEGYGYQAGDDLIKDVAHLLRKYQTKGSCLARWGSDEFLLFLPNTSQEKMKQIIKEILQHTFKIGNTEIKDALTIGSATITACIDTIHSAIHRAEQRLHRYKLLDTTSTKHHLIDALTTTLNEKSSETQEHSARLYDYSLQIADKLGMSDEEKNSLHLLSKLHDLGKIGIPDNILHKPGKLTPEERQTMEQHCIIGYRIAKSTPELSHIANLILTHHERWDGTGYPIRLKEDKIPLPSRILSVVDAFDAMTNDRIYRKKLPISVAIEELVKNSGSQFDPTIVHVFLEILENES